jgi:hypothetical protein
VVLVVPSIMLMVRLRNMVAEAVLEVLIMEAQPV